MGGAVESFKGREALQSDLDKFVGWAITNCVKFKKSKSPILHLQWSNPGCMYRPGDEILENSPTERDLGEVLVEAMSNLSQQCALSARNATRTIRCNRPSTVTE